MSRINSDFITNSRLSTLEPKDIVRILYLAENKWNKRKVEERMNRYSQTPIIGIGISNPQELTQVMNSDIPVIHIENDCKSLQAVQRRLLKKTRLLNRLLTSISSSLLGYVVSFTSQLKFKRGNDMIEIEIFENGILPIPNYIIGSTTLSITCALLWLTRKLLNKPEYIYTAKEGECILYRSDILDNNYYKYILPCFCLGLSFYFTKKKGILTV